MKRKQWFLSAGSLAVFALLFWASAPKRPIYRPPVVIQQRPPDLTPQVTSNAKELTRIVNSVNTERYPRISPDGNLMIYELYDNSKKSYNTSIMLKKLGDPGVSPLLTEGCATPSWIDNTSFLFAYLKPAKAVIAKSKINQLGINYVSPNGSGDDDSQPFYFKAQNKVLFFTKIGGEYQICTLDLNGQNLTAITNGQQAFPHPEKNVILFIKKVDKNWQIFKYDFESSQQTQLTTGTNVDCYHPAFSPDGKWIIFDKRQVIPREGHEKSIDLITSDETAYNNWIDHIESHLFIMDSDGFNYKQLTTGNTYNYGPSISTNGQIYFSSNAGNNYDIWRVKPNLE